MTRIMRISLPVALAVVVGWAAEPAEARGGRGGGRAGGGARAGGGGFRGGGGAYRGGGGGGWNVRSTSRPNVSQSRSFSGQGRNIDRNVNRNVSRDFNRDVDVDIDGHGGYWGGCCYHPVATAAAVTATSMITAAAIGSVVYSIPPSCQTTVVNGVTYEQCGDTWYAPQLSGSSASYVVVNPP